MISRLISFLVSSSDHHRPGSAIYGPWAKHSQPLVFVNTVTRAELSGYIGMLCLPEPKVFTLWPCHKLSKYTSR